MMIPTRRSTHERGVALVAVLVVMLLVVGVIGIFSMLAVGESQQARSDRMRAESMYWVQSASSQVQAQLRAYNIGPHALAGSAGTQEFWRVPGSGKRSLALTMPDGKQRTGFYEILPPATGAPSNSLAFDRDPASDQRGSVTMLLRGSTSATDPRPRTVRVVFRRSSLARYAIVSDAPIDAGNLGTSRIRGAIHSNNVEGAAVGVRLSGAQTSGARSISATVGSIQGSCGGSSCVANSGRAVSFTNVDRAFAEVERLHARGGCTRRIACFINDRVTWHPAETAPTYQVLLGSSDGCVRVRHAANRLRQDAGTAAIVDDRLTPPSIPTSTKSYCPAHGGMALLFNSDVQVEGVRPAGAPPVTIMARNTSRPNVTVRGVTNPRRQPASIYVVQRGATFGAANALSPVGLIAEGSVYLPAWAITSGGNQRLNMRNVAIAAQQGELSLGPMSLAMAGNLSGLSGTGEDITAGGGLNPCSAEANSFQSGNSMVLQGAVASRRAPVLGYGTSASCSFGYLNRTYEYASNLEWNPPPLYPTTDPWHVAEWDELAVTA